MDQTQLFALPIRIHNVMAHLDQLINDICIGELTVSIAVHDLLHALRKLLRLHQVGTLEDGNLFR